MQAGVGRAAYLVACCLVDATLIQIAAQPTQQQQLTTMFVDLTEPERQRFIKQSVCHIPGYTGHCPTIKFRHGKTFGANTAAIVEEMRDISPICRDPNYRSEDPAGMILRPISKSKGIQENPIMHLDTPHRPYVLGYTGFVPGLNFRYGSSFSLLADQSRYDFTTRLAQEEQRRAKERLDFVNTKPHLSSIRGKDNVTETLQHYTRIHKTPGNVPISGQLPPIAGYTGHIPGLKGSETSLSQTYYNAAQTGLTVLQEEKNKRHNLEAAREAVQDAMAYSHPH